MTPGTIIPKKERPPVSKPPNLACTSLSDSNRQQSSSPVEERLSRPAPQKPLPYIFPFSILTKTKQNRMPRKSSSKSDTPKSFEESLKELEGLVEELEGGEVPLDQTLEKFERGMKLVQFCHGRLNDAEKKLKILVKDKNGRFSLTDEEDLE
jgi:exodeoxyribonuclease VII small subunit